MGTGYWVLAIGRDTVFEKEINAELLVMEQEVYKTQEDRVKVRYTQQIADQQKEVAWVNLVVRSNQYNDNVAINGVKYKINGTTPHGKNNLRRVIIKVPPDHLDQLKSHNSEVTSWKRFALTILKNDHTCKYLGLAPTKTQMDRQKIIQKKYSGI